MDPNTETKPGDTPADPASAAAETTTTTETPATDAPKVDAAADKPAADKKPEPTLEEVLRESMKPSTETEKTSETPEKPAAAADAPKPDDANKAAKPDPAAVAAEDAKLMADAKPRTKERFQQLLTRQTELETKVAEVEPIVAENKQWRDIVNATGATPQEMVQNFEYMALVSTGTPESLEKALAILDGQREQLAVRLGRPVPGVDFLAGHKDLKDLVDAGEMDAEKAKELALLRRDRQTRQDAATRNTQSDEQREQALELGKREVNAVDASFKGVDPQYAEKIKLLQPKFVEIAKTRAPSEWAEAFRAEYLAIKLPAATTPAPRVPITPSTRSSVSTSNNKAEPTTMEGALRQGLGIGAAT